MVRSHNSLYKPTKMQAVTHIIPKYKLSRLSNATFNIPCSSSADAKTIPLRQRATCWSTRGRSYPLNKTVCLKTSDIRNKWAQLPKKTSNPTPKDLNPTQQISKVI